MSGIIKNNIGNLSQGCHDTNARAWSLHCRLFHLAAVGSALNSEAEPDIAHALRVQPPILNGDEGRATLLLESTRPPMKGSLEFQFDRAANVRIYIQFPGVRQTVCTNATDHDYGLKVFDCLAGWLLAVTGSTGKVHDIISQSQFNIA